MTAPTVEGLWCQSEPGVWCLFVPADARHVSACGRWMRDRAAEHGRDAPPAEGRVCPACVDAARTDDNGA